jgi:hypothetical protein
MFPVKYELNLYILQNSGLCPHSVSVCSVWFSQQTENVSPNSIKRLGFVAEKNNMFPARYELTLYILENSAFCPPSVFVCSLRFSQQTASVSPKSINGLGFAAET